MLKKLTSLPNKTYLNLWILYHCIIVLVFAVTFFIKGRAINIDADLFNMLPKPVYGKALNAADAKLTEITAQNVFILVSNEDFNEAKNKAIEAYDKLKDSDRFKNLTLYQDTSNFGTVVDFIDKNKYKLLDEETIIYLNKEGGVEAFSENALSEAYGAFTITSLDNLDNDPFMLKELGVKNFLKHVQDSGTKMSIKDGVLASNVNGKWYIMIRGTLSKKGSQLASKENAIRLIHEVCDKIENDTTKFVYSGTPFHSYKSSTSAASEITTISSISLAVVLIILLLIFKRHQPFVYSFGSIIISTITAICATLAIFGKMHILTLVFGTSLIGSCIDYSLHYFISWKANVEYTTGKDIRSHLLKGLSLSLISTILCYFVLMFAPFNLLKQMAVFSMSGIASTFLSVICIYPYIKVPESGRSIYLLKLIKTPEWYNKKLVGRIVVSCMFLISAGTLIIFHKNFKIENNVKELYKAEGREASDEEEASKVLQYNPSGWFIVSGNTIEETLQNEEAITSKLRIINKDNPKGGFVCTSAFIPSKKRQEESINASKLLLPLAEQQLDYLGYDSSYAKVLIDNFEKDNELIDMEKNVPEYLLSSISSAWIGEIDGKYYSVVLPVSVTNYDAYKSLADNENTFFISKVKSMNQDLDKLSRMILYLFVIVYIVIFVVLKRFYTLKQACKIISVPILIVLFIAAIFSVANIHLEFFSITGMILVFGLGLDYVIYMMENEKRKDTSDKAKLEPFAIGLSFVTTAVSFGALALSKFIPVHMIGLSIFIGLVVAYFSTFFYTRCKF